MLIGAVDEDGEALDDRCLRDQWMTLLLAGHEASATTLAWAFEELLRAPDEQERLIAEAEAELFGAPVEADHLSKLERIESAIKETLRLHPVTGTTARPGDDVRDGLQARAGEAGAVRDHDTEHRLCAQRGDARARAGDRAARMRLNEGLSARRSAGPTFWQSAESGRSPFAGCIAGLGDASAEGAMSSSAPGSSLRTLRSTSSGRALGGSTRSGQKAGRGAILRHRLFVAKRF